MTKPSDTERRGWSVANWAKLRDIPRSTAYWMAKEGHIRTVTLPNGRKIVPVEAEEEFAAKLNEQSAA